jgi:hypothetical protein
MRALGNRVGDNAIQAYDAKYQRLPPANASITNVNEVRAMDLE